ncbi:MAG: 50S ribosomal protein L25 [Patescibacteria group bacterium]|nr:50S ribosomal protein L25 [Patescibacteria group bacterium]MDD5121592.1 50S ribosomal protein L25 [Patescibacteria group bacterium]MDD5222225.1 50S ribosomal protein L25 [Patescibacteria group bacterium]MDD5396244.1 50S ribosomal protein L25 [Patescibacteria group bacterium]
MTLSLKAKSRTITGGKVNELRKEGQIPAIVYGHGFKNVNIIVSDGDFKKVFKEAGESSLVSLVVDDAKPIQVLVHDIQYQPLKNTIQHIDFYHVKADEKITAEAGLRFIGDAPAVKELSGVLVTPITKVKIECLPKDLVHELEVDISTLNTFEDAIRIKDLVVPAGIKIVGSLDEVVALVEAPRSEEELKSLEEKPEAKVEDVKTVKEETKAAEDKIEEEKTTEKTDK